MPQAPQNQRQKPSLPSLLELGVEDEHAVLDAVVAALLLAHAVDEDRVGRADAAGEPHPGGGHHAP